jgi:hypothetical protein
MNSEKHTQKIDSSLNNGSTTDILYERAISFLPWNVRITAASIPFKINTGEYELALTRLKILKNSHFIDEESKAMLKQCQYMQVKNFCQQAIKIGTSTADDKVKFSQEITRSCNNAFFKNPHFNKDFYPLWGNPLLCNRKVLNNQWLNAKHADVKTGEEYIKVCLGIGIYHKAAQFQSPEITVAARIKGREIFNQLKEANPTYSNANIEGRIAIINNDYKKVISIFNNTNNRANQLLWISATRFIKDRNTKDRALTLIDKIINESKNQIEKDAQ